MPPYDATVVAETTWAARSEPSAPAQGKPTGPVIAKGGGSLITLGGLTRTEYPGFAEEFDGVVRRVGEPVPALATERTS